MRRFCTNEAIFRDSTMENSQKLTRTSLEGSRSGSMTAGSMRFQPDARFRAWAEVRIWDMIVAEQLIKAAGDLSNGQSLDGQGLMHRDHKCLPIVLSMTLEVSEAPLGFHLTITDTCLFLHPHCSQGFSFASKFWQGNVRLSPTSNWYFTSLSSSLHIGLHFPSI